MDNQIRKTWFITGASKGLGLLFVKQLLERGDNVAATSRRLSDLEAAVGTHANFLPIEVDLTNEQSVATAINETIAKFGRLDVVVNNAGYGLLGAIEELSDAESRGNFDVNVFGLLNVIRQAMPHLREQGSGHIFNISSIGGFTGNFPGFGIYCATKFAVAGLSESLAAEVKEFGINVTVVLPGYFRTSFLESGSLAVPKNSIEAYTSTRASQEAHQNEINGNQAGDPEKGVAAIIDVTNAANPPLYLFLGSDAVSMAHTKIAAVDSEIAEWRSVSVSTDF
jgi:NAD(P)-dependent dehydrogenase (short-subunit alcohol dehydrogenase family)